MTDTPASFTELLDLASVRLRGAVVASNDDFFAEQENLLKPAEAVFLPHEYTDRGKWMDGWESRRKRGPGHDWAIVRLGVPGCVRGVRVDTAFFRGNFPSHCSIEACAAPSDSLPADLLGPNVEWVEILPKVELQGDSKNDFAIVSPYAFTHIRLNIFPDGGVARLRVYGDAVPDFRRIGHARGEIDLAAADHGGHVISCSDMFFGERRNLIMPDRALNMGDGWETRRRRGPGFDWAIVRLGARAAVTRLLIDTHHFKGNFPDTCSVLACDSPAATPSQLASPEHPWRPLLERTKLQADARHWFEDELLAGGPVTHVRLNVFPDGGISRFRVFGQLDADARLELGLRRFNALLPRDAEKGLLSCCASSRWVGAMMLARPFADVGMLLQAADSAWGKTGPDDWKEAFLAHPRIGEKQAEGHQEPTAKKWSQKEQAGVDDAPAETRAALAEINRRYEAKFGIVYLVCATGLSAEALLAIARSRIDNPLEKELAIAASEQHKITHLRLRKLLDL